VQLRAAPPPTPAKEARPASTNPPPPAGTRRLSKGFLDIDEAVSHAASNQNTEKKSLTEDVAQELFEQYKRNLQAAGKSVLHSSFV